MVKRTSAEPNERDGQICPGSMHPPRTGSGNALNGSCLLAKLTSLKFKQELILILDQI